MSKETGTKPASAGFTVWFTGLSGSGKSTLSEMVARELREFALRVEILDGDVVRTNLSKGLGFSKEDRDTNIRRVVNAEVTCYSDGRETPEESAREALRKLVTLGYLRNDTDGQHA